MVKKTKKIFVMPILIMFLMQIMVLQPLTAYAGTGTTTLGDDMYIGWHDGGVVYPNQETNPIYDGSGNIVSYVGSAVSMGVNEEGAAIKFNLSSIHGNVTSAALIIDVSEVNGNPILNLTKIMDDTWNTNSTHKPAYNVGDIINGYSNYSITSQGTKSFDVTAYIQAEQNTNNIASFALTGKNNNGDNDFAFICDPNSPNRPWLQVIYAPYNVTFDSQGGSLVNAITADYNTTIASPQAPTKTGYSFGGWYKDSACTNAWNFGVDKVIANTKLYAKWTINQYTVTFDSKLGSQVASKTVDYNSIIAAPEAPTRIGYSFGGWYKDTACTNAWNFAADKVTTDITLYAKWTINQYTVTFDSKLGSQVASKTVDYNSLIAAPEAPTRTGYSFGGWYKDTACTNVWDFGADKVTTDTTLYAKWTINQYTVTFDSKLGSQVASKTVDYNSLIAAPEAPTRTGCSFGGWYKDTECTNAWDFAADKVTTDTTLYAKWTINQYTVTFDSKLGSQVPSKTVDYNSLIAAPTVPTKTGCSFGGWYKDSACTNAWDFATDKVTDNIILYAKWIIKGDVNLDGKVDIMDLAEIAAHYNSKNGQTNWNAAYDLNSDGIVDIFDLVFVARLISPQ